jgi:Rps23 Pro-64 3,4-dihydroxylase Tpa1-like proline 4-hydroxylase
MMVLSLYENEFGVLRFFEYSNIIIYQSKYSPGQFFKPHKDGLFISQNEDCSIFSVVIYLNGSDGKHKGGNLLFIDPTDQQTVTASFTPKKVFVERKEEIVCESD